MTNHLFPLLTLSGAIGVGKTTVGQEISNLLDRSDIPHTFVDLDALTQTYPRPTDDPYGYQLAFANMRNLWANCIAAGSRNLIISRVVETSDHYDDIQLALPGCIPTIIQFRASDQELLDRIRKRELGSGRAWHEQRSLEIAHNIIGRVSWQS